MQPNDLGLLVPSWRNGQWESIQASNSSPNRFTADCCPTGWGKSIRLVGEALVRGGRALILTSSKPLQNQYSLEFRYLNPLDIRGKANYSCRATELGGEYYDGSPARTVAEGPCQFGDECGLKAYGCVYYDKVNQAKYRKLVIANYAAWISANLYTEGWGSFDFVAMDEADTAEDWLARMLAVKLAKCHSALLGRLPTTSHIPTWVRWANDTLPIVRTMVRTERRAVRKKHTKLRTLQSIESGLVRMCGMTDEWRVFQDNQNILFQPIWVHEYAESLLFNGANKVVATSATLVSNTLNLLGVPNAQMDYHSYPSTFPADRRPVYYYPVVGVNHRMTEDDKKRLVCVADEFISKRLDRKGIIHTVSFAWQDTFLKYSKYASQMIASSRSSVGSGGTSSASMTLSRFRAMKAPAILIGPNWTTGIDLAGKAAEYTIIPKVPFADYTDPLHTARSEDNPDYGWFHAGKVLTQSIGRAMRSETDQNETLILDRTFGRFPTEHKRYIPDWVWDAYSRPKDLPKPLEALR